MNILNLNKFGRDFRVQDYLIKFEKLKNMVAISRAGFHCIKKTKK